ncbi:MAG: oligosaccharide flippase family protein [Nitrososphaerales archaeon]
MSKHIKEVAEDFAKGGLHLFTGNAFSTIILAIGSIIVARLLGPEGLGLYTLSLALPSLVVGFIDLGINPAVTHFSAKLRVEGRLSLLSKMLRVSYINRVLIGSVVSAAFFLLSENLAYLLNRPEASSLIRISSFAVLVSSVFTLNNSAFLGLDKMREYSTLLITQSVVKTTLSPILILIGLGVSGALASYVVSYLLPAFVGYFMLNIYLTTLGKPSADSTASTLKVMLRYGFPLYLSNIIGIIISQLRILILAYFASDAEIGNFSAVLTLSSAMNVLILPLSALFPAFSKLKDESDLRTMFKACVKYASLLMVPSTILVMVLSKELIFTLYSRAFDLAPRFLTLFMIQFLYVVVGLIVLTYLLSGVGQTVIILRAELVNFFLFLPLVSVLTPLYKVDGMIVATLISSLASLLYCLYAAVKRLGVNIDYKSSMLILLTSLLASIPTLGLLTLRLGSLLSLILGVLLYFVTYITLLPLLGAVAENDVENLKQIVSKLGLLWPLIRPILSYVERLAKFSLSGRVKSE